MADADEGSGSAADTSDGPGGGQLSPSQTSRTKLEKAARQDRLAAAMRENLLKRKQQQRARNSGRPNPK